MFLNVQIDLIILKTDDKELKGLVEVSGKSHFCEIEKTQFKVTKLLKSITIVLNVGFLRNFVHTTPASNKIQL